MTTSLTPAEQHRLHTTIALAQLLERVEQRPHGITARPVALPAGPINVETAQLSAEQYRLLVRQLSTLLQEELPAPARDAILNRFPAAAQLYENLNYPAAGLSRQPLELAVQAEMATHDLLARLARPRPRA